MRLTPLVRASLALALASTVMVLGTASRAEPLLRGGIGLQSCDKLAPNLKPGAGLDHLPNALLFYWTQGYMSAANIHLINEYTDYVDIGAIDEPTVTKMIAEYCANNPDKRPVNALDLFITKLPKISIKDTDAFDPWEH